MDTAIGMYSVSPCLRSSTAGFASSKEVDSSAQKLSKFVSVGLPFSFHKSRMISGASISRMALATHSSMALCSAVGALEESSVRA